MQRHFTRWQRGRTDPEPHPWGCKTSSLVLIPKVSLVQDGNELTAVLPHHLPIYPASPSLQPLPCLRWGMGTYLTMHLNSSMHLRSVLFNGAEGRAQGSACDQLLAAKVSSLNRGLLRAPFSQTWGGHPAVPELLHSLLQIQTKPTAPGDNRPPKHGLTPAIEQLSPLDVERSSHLPKAPSSAARECLCLILETIRMMKAWMVSLSSQPGCISHVLCVLLLGTTDTATLGSLHPKTWSTNSTWGHQK